MLAQGVPNYKFSISGSNGNMMSSTEDTASNVFPATDGMMTEGNQKQGPFGQGNRFFYAVDPIASSPRANQVSFSRRDFYN